MHATSPTPNRSAKLWIGPSGWSYPDWRGNFYPASRPRGFKPLRYLSQFFKTVEVNTSFYRTPAPEMTAAWPPQVPADFRFAFKLNRRFTHERAEFPSQPEFDAFRQAVQPIAQARMLGPILIQFPWSFRNQPESIDWIARLSDRLAEFERFVELRHSSWLEPKTLDRLAQFGGVCNIDQPLLRDCLPPSTQILGPNAYVRLHGRNAAQWFTAKIPYERYNYLYSNPELREWAARIIEMSRSAENIYLFTNNHYRGQGPANALELRAMLENFRPPIPPELEAAFPQLSAIAAPPRQPNLFGGS